MLVYKFGGASVKDAVGIRNLSEIVASVNEPLVIVVSAFGKTTNGLENVLGKWFSGDSSYIDSLSALVAYHMGVIRDLDMEGDDTEAAFADELGTLDEYLKQSPRGNYDYEYDQVVSFGEIWSTIIVSGFLRKAGLKNRWIDIRKVLITDGTHRDANIDWEESSRRALSVFDFRGISLYLTQGFIGGTADGRTTTLGREGSDYTAAVLANMLNASGVVVWKDVPGLLNADPHWLPDAVQLPAVSYKEAVEMTFSGAKVIHPKTIRPLHNKCIPLNVKSFLNPEAAGTMILPDAGGAPGIPVYVRKENQILISILSRDFSFAISDNMSRIFILLNESGIKVNLVQASAVSINVCADNEKSRIDRLIALLENEFRVLYNDHVEMITIRHYTPGAIAGMTAGRQVMIEQRTRRTVRFVFTQQEQP